jgi:hypothetical protein
MHIYILYSSDAIRPVKMVRLPGPHNPSICLLGWAFLGDTAHRFDITDSFFEYRETITLLEKLSTHSLFLLCRLIHPSIQLPTNHPPINALYILARMLHSFTIPPFRLPRVEHPPPVTIHRPAPG